MRGRTSTSLINHSQNPNPSVLNRYIAYGTEWISGSPWIAVLRTKEGERCHRTRGGQASVCGLLQRST